MSAYTQHTNVGQSPLDTAAPWNPLDYGVEIVRREEVQKFLDAIPEPASVTEARWKVIEAYESGAIGAVEAFRALEAYGCLHDADDFFQSYIVGARSRLLLGETPPKTADVAPGQAKAVRVTSHAYRGLDALAEARSGRAA